MSDDLPDRLAENTEEYVTFTVDKQLLGISVLKVQEILPPQGFTHVPLSHCAVRGLLNLRGQIVTAIDLRERLGLPKRNEQDAFTNIIVNDGGELFSLLVDSVGEVLTVAKNIFESVPQTLDVTWKECCVGVFRLPKELLIIVNVSSLLSLGATRKLQEEKGATI